MSNHILNLLVYLANNDYVKCAAEPSNEYIEFCFTKNKYIISFNYFPEEEKINFSLFKDNIEIKSGLDLPEDIVIVLQEVIK